MGTIAFSCATLGFVLSARFKAFALVPASLLALGPTLVFGFVNGWGTLGLVLATMANLMILQASYCVGGILLRRFGKPAERRAPRLRHMRVMQRARGLTKSLGGLTRHRARARMRSVVLAVAQLSFELAGCQQNGRYRA